MVKSGLNSGAKPWTQPNYNIPFEIKVKILMVIFTGIIYSLWYSKYTGNWKLRCVADHDKDYEFTSAQQYLFL